MSLKNLKDIDVKKIEIDEIELTHEQKCLVNGHAYMIGWEVAERDVQSYGVDYAKAELEYYNYQECNKVIGPNTGFAAGYSDNIYMREDKWWES